MVFCNGKNVVASAKRLGQVTILILVDGFLQYIISWLYLKSLKSHNPYFSRWFSAIIKTFNGIFHLLVVTILILVDGFLQ